MRCRSSGNAKRSKRLKLLRELRSGVGKYLEPQDEGYKKLLDSSYSKLRVISAHNTPTALHKRIQSSLSGLLRSGYFTHNLVIKDKQTRITAVTRFAAGKRGLTYPYLGFRLFAFPWDSDNSQTDNAKESMHVLRELNDYMTAKGNELCNDGETNQFNITLVNYMDPGHVTTPLVDEPYYQMGVSAVHWHSDQSVKDNCSIGVYSHTVGEGDDKSKPWSIGLKVAWDVMTPAVKIPVQDGSCYFLLHDMNMTHQHTVIVGDKPRFSSTHRVVISKGNTLKYISERCQCAELTVSCLEAEAAVWDKDEMKQCLEIQREVEFEWIRQFWSLGHLNAEKHVGFWLGEVKKMELTWEKIESAAKTLYDRLLKIDMASSKCKDNVLSHCTILLQHLEIRQQSRQDWRDRYSSSLLKYLADTHQPVERPSFPCHHHPHFPYDQSQAIERLKEKIDEVNKVPSV